MFCPLDISPDVTQSKKYKDIKELSDFGQALNKDGANEFFNIKSIKLVSDTNGYKQKQEIFDLITIKQIPYNYKFNYFDINEKINKKSSVYTPYNHPQASGFTFGNPSNKETYKAKLTKEIDFGEQNYTWNKTKFDFKALYRDMNMIFVYVDREFFRSLVGYVNNTMSF